MQTRQNHEKENDNQASNDGLEVVVIQTFIYVSIPLIIGSIKEPIDNGEDEVNDNVKQGVQGMQETNWDGAQACVNHHEDGIECVLCNIIGINWVIICQHAPVPRGYPQAGSCSNDMDEPKELVVTLQGVFFAGVKLHFDLHRLFICS